MLNLLMRSRSMNMRREACQDDCNNRDLAILNIYMSTSVPGVQEIPNISVFGCCCPSFVFLQFFDSRLSLTFVVFAVFLEL